MEDLIKRIAGLKQSHYSCEDGYYSCPLSEGGCANDQWDKDECDCGADDHNKEVDAIIVEVRKQWIS
jgi:hypothetical protein